MMDVSFIKMSESLKSSSSLIGDNFDAIKQFSTDVKDAANQMSSFNEGVVRDMETLIQQIDRSVSSINTMSEMLKVSADTNSATMDSIQSSFLDSIGRINHQIIELTEKTQDSFSRSMTESSVVIASHLQQGIKSAIANLDAVVEKFDKNQRLLANTVASLPEQTMAFNKSATERVEAKLEEIKNTLSE
jgi:methyl-accepting chemotaxis protein